LTPLVVSARPQGLAPTADDAVAQLKEKPGKDLHVMGSGELIQTLMRHDLIDE
jgi:dihydrofolate reductase